MSAKSNLAIDLVTAAAFLVASNPPLTGLPVHEWLGVSLAAVMIVHLLFHWDWIAHLTTRLLRVPGRGARLNYAVDILLFVSFTALVLSGLMISRHFMAAIGLPGAPRREWRQIHEMAADASLVAVGVHLGLHWKWVVFQLAQLVGVRRPAPARQAVGSSLAPDAAE